MNLYEKAKRGLIGKRALPRLVDVRPVGENYSIQDRSDNRVVLSRDDAVVAYYALGVALK